MKNLTGYKYGLLTVISYSGQGKWSCLCECGKEKIIKTSNLKKAKSCGCKRGNNYKDLTGQKFGRLKVISRAENKNNKVQWNCLCDCGGLKTTSSNLLRRGEIKRCGGPNCITLNFKDLSNKKFGKLTANHIVGRNKYRAIKWHCTCECGRNLTVYAHHLIHGKSKSCGSCIKIKDLAGKKYGKLTVISRAPNNHLNQIQWNCICDCGNTCTILSKCLSGGNTKSCGCLLKYKDPYLSSKKALFRKYEKSAKTRNYSFDLNFNDFLEIIQRNCFYCGSAPSQKYKLWGVVRCEGILYTGIDRIDNKNGYKLGNIVPCCKKCNYLKWSKSRKQFIAWLKKCHKHLSERKFFEIKLFSDLPSETISSQRSLYWIYKNTLAKKRGHDFKLPLNEFINITQQNCFYCGSSPQRYFQKEKTKKGFLYNGIDRINNTKGYYSGNIVPCCKSCNESKSDLDRNDFISHIEKCYHYLIEKSSYA